MTPSRFLRLAGATAGGLTVAGAAVVITASAAGVPFSAFAASPAPKPSASATPAKPSSTAACDAFIGHLAKDLGKSTSDVKAAARKAAGETIDDQVKAGKLSAEQAAKIKAKLAAGDACAGVMGTGPKGHDGGPGRGPGQHLAADVAAALGTTEADLQAQLKSGKSLKDLAAAKGMDEAAFRAAYLKAVKADLDQQVTAGKLTAQQESAMLQKLQSAPIPFWNGAAKPRPAASPQATT